MHKGEFTYDEYATFLTAIAMNSPQKQKNFGCLPQHEFFNIENPKNPDGE